MQSTYAQALAGIGGLSFPSKMPTASYSIPAEFCKLGSLLQRVENSTCSGCYALKGCYTFPSTRDAMDRRFSAVTAALADPVAAGVFVENFATVLNRHRALTDVQIARNGRPGSHDGRYFRWHDSGDIQSPDHLGLIVSIAGFTPEVAHWLPTREAGFVSEFLRKIGDFPDNLRVRLSIPQVNSGIPAGFLKLLTNPRVTVSGVHAKNCHPPEGLQPCVAPLQQGSCGNCRACWSPEGVSYRLH